MPLSPWVPVWDDGPDQRAAPARPAQTLEIAGYECASSGGSGFTVRSEMGLRSALCGALRPRQVTGAR